MNNQPKIDIKQHKTLRNMILSIGVLSAVTGICLLPFEGCRVFSYGALVFTGMSILLYFTHIYLITTISQTASLYLLSWLLIVSFVASSTGGVTGPMGYALVPLPMVSLFFFSTRRAVIWCAFVVLACLITDYFSATLWGEVEHIASIVILQAAILATFSIGCVFRFVIHKSDIVRDKVVDDAIAVLNSYSRKDFSNVLEIDSSDRAFLNLASGINNLGKDLAKSLHQLESYQNNLENIIEKKTNELENTYSKLVSTSRLASIGEMAGGIAHEINNPLAIILLRASQARRMLEAHKDILDPRTFEFLEAIESTVTRTKKIIKGLSAFSRSGENDEFKIETISHILEDTLLMCEEDFKNQNIELSIANIPSNLTLECRPVQISQVLLNLLNNARFAAQKHDGEKYVKLEFEELSDLVRIAVLDSGPGIPIDIRDKILSPFFTTKKVGEGTGLGLSISTGIAQSHHGRLYLDTECCNTRFVLELPKVQSKYKAA